MRLEIDVHGLAVNNSGGTGGKGFVQLTMNLRNID
jgi:hypothetical protein